MKTRLVYVLLLSLALLNSSFTQVGAQTTPLMEPENGLSAMSLSGSTASLSPLQNISAISAGAGHTCALDSGGGVQCWGDNGYGQLGDGTTTDRSIPAVVPGLSGRVTALTSGEVHTCALNTQGGVQCWGDNWSGQLGDGTTTNRNVPVQVIGLENGIAAIAAGGYHTCALTTDGEVMCWGHNSSGQLGDDTTIDHVTPAPVIGLESGVAAISAGETHTCVITTGGGVQCWGSNEDGKLGDGTNTYRSTPVAVIGLESGISAISAGWRHTCALTTESGVMCWGDNEFGQLADGTTTDRSMPVGVIGLENGVAAITLGMIHTCALVNGGGIQCWGNNAAGQLGDGTTIDRVTPTQVSSLESGMSAVIAGWYHTCALTMEGRVKCWGNNLDGQLGSVTPTRGSLIPMGVIGLETGVSAITAGAGHSCALAESGGVQCWGSNVVGQLGDGSMSDRSLPSAVSGLESGITTMDAGEDHTCALAEEGGILCWGYNRMGQLGDGTDIYRNTPAPVIGLESAMQTVAAGDMHTCALTTEGGGLCWGDNGYGQLGIGASINSSSTPVPVVGLESGLANIDAGGYHTCALTEDGGVKCWGYNWSGQVGDGTTTQRYFPVQVSGLYSGVKAIATGGAHTCALTTEGGVWCWGDNGYGQLGNSAVINSSSVPVQVSGLESGVESIAANWYHTCAVTTSGGVLCWGGNAAGQLGDGTTTNRIIPVPVIGLESGVSAVAAGEYHTCALTTEGGVQCWGTNGFGQLGDGSILWISTPVDVLTLLTFFLPLIFRN